MKVLEVSDDTSMICRRTVLAFADLSYAYHRRLIARLYSGAVKPGAADDYCYAIRRLLASVESRDPDALARPTLLKSANLKWHLADLHEGRSARTVRDACKALKSALGLFLPRLDTELLSAEIENLKAAASPEFAPTRSRAISEDRMPRPWQDAMKRLDDACICETCARRKSGEPTGDDAKCKCKVKHPISAVSVANAKGNLKRYLGAQVRHGCDDPSMAIEALLSRTSLGHYRAEVHKEDAPWLTADRLKALRFAISHALPGHDLSFLNDEIAAHRQAYPVLAPSYANASQCPSMSFRKRRENASRRRSAPVVSAPPRALTGN